MESQAERAFAFFSRSASTIASTTISCAERAESKLGAAVGDWPVISAASEERKFCAPIWGSTGEG